MNPGQRGFTLIELLVTLTILAIGLMVAVPGMIGFQRSAELTSAANTLTSALNAARSEAMKRNMFAVVAPQSGGAWSTGYVVFVDVDRNNALGDGDITITRQPAPPANLEVLGTGTAGGSAPFIRFDGSGFTRDQGGAYTNLAVTIRRRDTVGKADEYNQTRRVMVTQTGRVRTCKPAGASDTNCDPAAP